MQVKFKQTMKGIEVQVGKAWLPGYYLSDVAAKKAADVYIAKIEEDRRTRRKKKASNK